MHLFTLLEVLIDKLGLTVSNGSLLACLEVDVATMTLSFTDETVFELIQCCHDVEQEGSQFVEVVEQEKARVKQQVMVDVKQLLMSLYNDNSSIQLVYQTFISAKAQQGEL